MEITSLRGHQDALFFLTTPCPELGPARHANEVASRQSMCGGRPVMTASHALRFLVVYDKSPSASIR